jgi:hypothetical protein
VAVRRVVAAIDVVINGQRNLDRLASMYLAVERTVISASAAMSRFATSTTSTSRAVQGLSTVMRNASQGFGGLVANIEKGRSQMDQHSKTTRGLTSNILDLTKSMLLFSVLLPLVQLPQRAIESFADFIRVGSEWQDQMRVSNALLGLSEDQFKTFNTQVQNVAIQQGVATDSMRELLQTAASSVSAIKPNTEALQQLGKAAYDASVALELTNQSARIARATGTDAKEATTTLIQVMSTYGLTMEHVADVSDSLFAITDVGTVKFSELEATLPRVTAAMGPLIQRYTTAEEKMSVMNESFAAFAAMTQTMPAEQAATSFANIFKDVSQMTGKQKQLVTSWENIRKQQGMGNDMSLAPENLLNQGPLGTLVQLRKIFDLRGAMVDKYVANQRRLGNTGEEDALRVAGQSQLMGAYFQDMRAVRGFQNTSVEQLQRSQQDYEASRGGAVNRGLEQRSKSFADAQTRMGVAVVALKTKLFESIEAPMIAGVDPITNLISNLINNVDFQNSSLLNKMRMMGTSFIEAFSNWFNTGGQQQLRSVGHDIGVFVGDAVTSFFKGGKDNVLIEAGKAFSESFISGVRQTMPELLQAFVQSDLTKMVAEAIAIRYVTKSRIPNAASYALATAVPALTLAAPSAGENGGIGQYALPAAGAIITSAALVAGARRFGSSPVFGRTGIPSPAGGMRSFRDIFDVVGLMAATRAGSPTTGAGTLAGGLKGLGKLGGGAALAGITAVPEILAAKNDRERWEAIGGGIGAVGGGIGGALIGGAVLSPIMSLILGGLGGAGGRMAGGKLWEMTHAGTGQGAAGALDDTAAPERVAMAEVFATGFDNSLAVPLLTQIRDVLIRAGGGGAISGITGSGTTATTTGTGTGKGLAASFTDQLNTGELTNQQAQAACGPAAAAFFAKAYGRNPSLKEAYAIVTSIQGGDPASSGGTRGVATLGAALGQMGLQSEVYQGGSIDWGRLANNAQAGIPGIVNIGPKGNFPGHYFQIGGWDPATNKFNVGPSGSVLSKYGGKAEMTPEEMMAMGPSLGAVYGLGSTGTGKGPVTEADIAAIQGSAGTGTGPGGTGGGGTVINIQSLMTVEHMDGNTDIRALMGQMADMLRQLSTGGSVVGQTGSIAP